MDTYKPQRSTSHLASSATCLPVEVTTHWRTKVSALLRVLGDTVRVRIDKNAGCFALVCPRLYLHRVAQTFGTSANPIAGYELVRDPVERMIARTRVDSLSILSISHIS